MATSEDIKMAVDNCVALVAVTGDGPTELDVTADVVSGQVCDASIGVGDLEAAVRADRGDGPGVAVADVSALLGREGRVVASGGDGVASRT